MRKLLTVVGVLALLLLLDFGGRLFNEHQLNSTIKTHTNNVGGVSSSLDQWPFFWNMAMGSKVSDATIDLHDIVKSPINVALLRIGVGNLKFDRGSVFGGKPRISGTGSIQVTAVLTTDNVREATNGGAVKFFDKYVQLTVNGHQVHGQLRVKDRKILVLDKSYPTSIPLPDKTVLPCDPTDASVSAGGDIVVGCSSTKLPPILLDAVGTKGLRDASSK